MLGLIIKQTTRIKRIFHIIQGLQVPSSMFRIDRINQNDCNAFITHIIDWVGGRPLIIKQDVNFNLFFFSTKYYLWSRIFLTFKKNISYSCGPEPF